MTNQELATLSIRFQNASLVFSPDFLSKLPVSVAQAMDASPKKLLLLERQFSKAIPGTGVNDSIRLGAVGDGTTNGAGGIIQFDPRDFLSIPPGSAASFAGTFALRIAHEIAHTLDSAPIAHPDNFTDPITYANARARNEGFALRTELTVLDDWNTNSASPYRLSSLSADAAVGTRNLQYQFADIQTTGAARGLTQT